MRKFIFLISFWCLPVIGSTLCFAQNITRIYSSDSMTISKFFKIKTQKSGFDNAYFQLSGYDIKPNIDYRNLNVYRVMKNGVTDNMHNSSFRNYNNICFLGGFHLVFGGTIDFTFSERDSNLILLSSQAAECEPYEGLGYSVNNGTSYNPVFPMGFMRFVGGFGINPLNDSIMYAVYSQSGTYTYKSTNRGSNWFITDTLANTLRGVIKVNPFNTSIVFIAAGTTLLRSSDSGYNFSNISVSDAAINSMEFDSLSRSIYVTSNTGTTLGIFKSDQNGLTWTRIFDKLCNAMEIDPLNNNIIYAGTNEGIYRSTNAGTTWTLYNNGFSGSRSVIGLVKNPDMGDTVLAVTTKGVYKVYGPFQSFTDYNYLPLKIGNSWTYYWSDPNMQTGFHKTTIIGDSIIDNIRYFKVDRMFPGYTTTGIPGKLITLDSLTGNIFVYNTGSTCSRYSNRILMDSLNAKKNDAIVGCPNLANGLCRDTGTISIFGNSARFKSFTSPYTAPLEIRHTYSEKFGITSASIIEIGSTGYNLVGCAIDGVVYGDTAVFSPFKTYLPLKVGNSWTYRWESEGGQYSGYVKTRIIKDTIINGANYYGFSSWIPGLAEGGLITLDTSTGNIYRYNPGFICGPHPNKELLDSLAAKINNVSYKCFGSPGVSTCLDTGSAVHFGSPVKTKSFSRGNSDPRYSSKFGIVRIRMFNEVSFDNYELKGCIIDGIVYGDTNTYPLISGTVKFSDNNQPASNGYVKALKLNTSNGNIITSDSVQIGINGEYILNNVPNDLYYIVAYPNSEKQADFIPTYYPSTITWQNAVKVNSANNPSNVNISVYRKNIMGGAYSVNGWITTQTTNPYAGIKDAIVYIKQGNVFRDYFITQASGQYNLNSLSSGNYEIVADRLGYVSAQQNAVITNSNLENINFALVHVGIQNVTDVIPTKYNLYQNYPNPFNPVTNIKFDIPKSSFVTLKVYNVLGKEVNVLLNEVKDAGSYRVDFDASALPSGVYFYRLETETFTETRRMMLLK